MDTLFVHPPMRAVTQYTAAVRRSIPSYTKPQAPRRHYHLCYMWNFD